MTNQQGVTGVFRTKGTGNTEALGVQWESGERPIRVEYERTKIGEDVVRELEVLLDRIAKLDPDATLASIDRLPRRMRGSLRAVLTNHRL